MKQQRPSPLAGWRVAAHEPPGRYETSGVEGECEPGSRGRVLRNRLGIRSSREMAAAESAALRIAEEALLGATPPAHRFTAADIRAIHEFWLGEIYDWAGAYRRTNLSTRDGFLFASARLIDSLMDELERGPLREFTPCRMADERDLARALGVVHAELILIHPFREGNGRCARLLAVLMAMQAGVPALDFSAMRSGPGRRRYFAAIRAAQGRDYEPITAEFNRVIARTRRPGARRARA